MKIARLRNSGELELKNEIIEYPPELEGGRNLILNSDNLNRIGLYGVTGNITIEQLNTSPTNEVWHLSNIVRTVSNYVWRLSLKSIAPKFDEADKEYTLSFYMKANTDQTMRALVNYGRIIKYSSTSVNNEYKHYSIVISPRLVNVATSHPCFISLVGDNLSDVYVYGIKLEVGNKSTEWTPAPEDLGLEYPDFIKKFSQKIYPHGVILTPEIIEFPIELVGKRNLFSGEFYKDINNYDGVSVYRYHLTNLKSNKRYVVRSWLKEGEVAESGFWITLTSGHPNPNNASANGGTYSHIINNGNPVNSQVLPRNDVPVYVSYYPSSADPSVLDKYNVSIQQLDNGYISEWNPAPYDLGFNYSEDIDSFGIRPFGDMTMVSEIREIPSDLFGANRNLILNSNSNFKNQSGYSGATFVATENTEVEEWGTNEATRIQTSGGTHMLKLTPSIYYKFSVRATYSVYIKNNSQHSMRMRFNGFNSTYIHLAAGEQKRVVVTGNFRDNYAWFQRQLWANDISHDLDVSLWREKLELGDNVTRWTPAPEDLGFNYPEEIQSF